MSSQNIYFRGFAGQKIYFQPLKGKIIYFLYTIMWNLEAKIFIFLFSRGCRPEYLFSLLPRPEYLFTKSARPPPESNGRPLNYFLWTVMTILSWFVIVKNLKKSFFRDFVSLFSVTVNIFCNFLWKISKKSIFSHENHFYYFLWIVKRTYFPWTVIQENNFSLLVIRPPFFLPLNNYRQADAVTKKLLLGQIFRAK